MLPPVAAVTDVLRGQTSQSQAVSPTPRVQIGQPPAEVRAPSDVPGLAPVADRPTVLSLSSQTQLAQGLSLAAETVGAMMKIARRDGEPLPDYAGRIAEAIAALSSAQRAALQRALNQLVKGLTIRLLAEILQNPAGPEATRLSLQLERRSATDRDLAARGVVSSYRQNDSSGMPAAVLSGAPAPPNRAPSPAPGSAPIQAQAAAPAAAGGFVPNSGGSDTLSGASTKQPVDRMETRPPGAAATPMEPSGGAGPGTSLGAGDEGTASMPAAPLAGDLGDQAPIRGSDLAAIAQQDPQGAEQALQAPSVSDDDAPQAVAARGRSLPDSTEEITYDAMALVRERALSATTMQEASVTGSSDVPMPARAAASGGAGNGLLTAILATGWLAGAAGDGAVITPTLAEVPPSPDTAPAPATAESTVEGPAAAATQASAAMDIRPGMAADPAALAAEPERSPAADHHAGPDASPAELQLAMVAQAVMLARAAPRDALVPVYVPYPPREEEDEDEERASVSAVDRVDEDGSRGNNGRQPDQQADDNSDGHEEAESEAGAAAEGDAASSDAQQFYRRMTAW
jgi:hypothetical protein